MKKIVLSIFIALTVPLQLSAALQAPDRIEIPPMVTGSAISLTGGPHIAMVDHSVLSRNRLLIFMGGTHSYPGNYLYFTTLAAHGGYHVLNLSYLNGVSSQSCLDDPDSLCYEKFRQEIVWGGDVSPCVSVDSANSIMNRIVRALEYLVKTDGRGGWDAFIDRGGHLIFERIVLAGHSQGAGHAVYLAKQFPVERVLLFSGPNDWMMKARKAAGWLGQESSTPLSEYYTLLHRKDEVGIFKWQYEIRRRLGGGEACDTVNVDRDVPPFNFARCLVTSEPSAIPSDGRGVFHNSIIMDSYTPRLKTVCRCSRTSGGICSICLPSPIPPVCARCLRRVVSGCRLCRFEMLPVAFCIDSICPLKRRFV